MKPISRFLFILAIIAAAMGLQATPGQGQASDPVAEQNLDLDPYGRVVDLVFDQDLDLEAPWDRFRFDMDMVQPLSRDGGAFVRDITGDNVPDLFLTSWSSELLFFPGLSGSPRRFGEGRYLRHTVAGVTEDSYYFSGTSAVWSNGDVGDLDGDGEDDLVIGRDVFTNAGTASEPLLEYKLTLSSGEWDPAGSIGDLNGDGKADIVTSSSYAGKHWVHWNNSTPGSFSFTAEQLYAFGNAYNNCLTMGDLDGDGLLDLAGPAGIYFNGGTDEEPSFNFASPSAWNVSGGPGWLSDSDQPGKVFLVDADGDNLLDAYVSSLSDTVWQVLFYKNIGSASAHNLQYQGPVAVASSPINFSYRGKSTPSISPNKAFVAAGDVDGNGLPDLLVSDSGGNSFGVPAILWNFPLEDSSGEQVLAYQDLYTYPTLSQVGTTCGGTTDALCRPPNLFSAWTDLDDDGLPDAVRTDQWTESYLLYKRIRTGEMPFTLGSDSELPAVSSQAVARGVTTLDFNSDGALDMVTGTANGRLLYFENTSPGTFADGVLLTDSGGTPIDIGDNSWPAAINLNGDSCMDYLVTTGATFNNSIRKVLCVTAGAVDGYSDGGLLGTPEQDPVNVSHNSAHEDSITSLDVNGDGLQDAVLADSSSRVWLLENTGNSSAASFSLKGLTISRTTAAYLEIVNAHHLRLYFGLPPLAGQTNIAYHGLPLAGGGSLSGEVTLGTSPFPNYTLDVDLAGTGSGSVSSVPEGIDCGSTCEAEFAYDTPVTLSAAPATGSTFTGWSGACSGTGTCQVTMDAARAVTATFTRLTPTLTLTKTGTGAGTVTSSPAGINCGAACTYDFDYNTPVTLTANPSEGSTFLGWYGACSGTGTCSVTMSTARSVIASFNLITYGVLVTNINSSYGSVTSSPAGIDCGSTCFAMFGYHTQVTLTANPVEGYMLTGWSGSCTGKTNCVLTMDGTKSVLASFGVRRHTISGNAGVAYADITYTGGRTIADASGDYSITLDYLWSGTVTPSLSGYFFTPTSRSYTNLSADQTDQNFTARIRKVFKSSDINDGWVLESSETSNAGGTLNSTAATLRIGDDATKKQYRSILSFATGGALPDNAVITKVTLKIKKQGLSGGGDPITDFQGLKAAIKKGYFGTAAGLATGDFQATASKGLGPFTPALTSGWYSLNLTSAKTYINKMAAGAGLTQIRLYFTLDDNNNSTANYLSLYSGNAALADRPQLIIEYYIP